MPDKNYPAVISEDLQWCKGGPASAMLILGSRWKDSYGNTYHTASIHAATRTPRGEIRERQAYARSSIEYGYSDAYLETAAELLEKHHGWPLRKVNYPARGMLEPVREWLRRCGVLAVATQVHDAQRRRDLL